MTLPPERPGRPTMPRLARTVMSSSPGPPHGREPRRDQSRDLRMTSGSERWWRANGVQPVHLRRGGRTAWVGVLVGRLRRGRRRGPVGAARAAAGPLEHGRCLPHPGDGPVAVRGDVDHGPRSSGRSRSGATPIHARAICRASGAATNPHPGISPTPCARWPSSHRQVQRKRPLPIALTNSRLSPHWPSGDRVALLNQEKVWS